MSLWELCSLMAVLGIGLFWLMVMPLSSYPSQLSVELGDPPVYYSAAAGLSEGRGWEPNYFIADYPDGKLSYVEAHPALVLIITNFFHIFGRNSYSLQIYNIIAAQILILLMASAMRTFLDTTEGNGKLALIFTLVAILLPAHFVLFGLGAVTVPGALLFLTAAASMLNNDIPAKIRNLIIGASLFLSLFLRPEAAALAAVLVMLLGFRYIILRFFTAWKIRIIGMAAVLFIAAMLWLQLPKLIEGFPPAWKSLAVFYLKYDPHTGTFRPMQENWWMINKILCRINLSGKSGGVLSNTTIGTDLRDHPVSFLRYLIGSLPKTAFPFVEAVSIAHLRLDRIPGFPAMLILVILFVGAGINSRTRIIVFSAAIFCLLVPLLNAGAGARHMLTFSPTILSLALPQGLRLWRRRPRFLIGLEPWMKGAGVAAVVFLMFYNVMSIIQIRTDEVNNSYAGIIKDIEKLTTKGDVVASNYPQLITCMTGLKTVGATWLLENSYYLVKNFHPDFIIIDDGRRGVIDYTLLIHLGNVLPDYIPVIHNDKGRYMIFRSAKHGHGQADETETLTGGRQTDGDNT